MMIAMRSQLGLAAWQITMLFIVPPLLIGLFVIWRAIHRATHHPDGNVLEPPKRKRGE